ncbi:MAG: DNA polymerase III subunit gamma/tau [Candidatus Symbiodolus clandestinus]
MSYQVLARKWRPQCYADVVGQAHALAVLSYSCTHNRLHHAYLFSGSRGVGKTTLARLLAKGLNCATGITATPCRQCGPCQEIEQGRFVDLLEIDAASRTTVEDTRELLDNVHYAPVAGRFKIYLIDEVHMLSRHSFNALLKTLEEPPPHVKFLLATTDPQKLPATLLSRCLQLHLPLLSVEKIEEQLQRIAQAEKIETERPALRLLAEAAQGSLRDALTLMDQALALGAGHLLTTAVNQLLGTLDTQQALVLVEALQRADSAALLQKVEQLLEQGIAADPLLAAMASILHQIALQQWLPRDTPGEIDHLGQRIRALAQLIDPMDLQLYYQTLLIGRKELALAPSPRMGVEMTLLRAIAFYPQNGLIPSHSAQEQTSQVDGGVTDAAKAKPQLTTPNAPTEKTTAPSTKPKEAAAAQLTEQSKPAGDLIAAKVVDTPEHSPLNQTEQLMAIHQQLQVRRQQQRSSSKSSSLSSPTRSQPVKAEPASDLPAKAAVVSAPNPVTPSSPMTNQQLSSRLAVSAAKQDSWSAEIASLPLPKRLEQLVLHCICEQPTPNEFQLYFQVAQRHLNYPGAEEQLAKALSAVKGEVVTVTLQACDELAQLTPWEWRQRIAEEKKQQAQQALQADEHLQRFQRDFAAEIDETTIQPTDE